MVLSSAQNVKVYCKPRRNCHSGMTFSSSWIIKLKHMSDCSYLQKPPNHYITFSDFFFFFMLGKNKTKRPNLESNVLYVYVWRAVRRAELHQGKFVMHLQQGRWNVIVKVFTFLISLGHCGFLSDRIQGLGAHDRTFLPAGSRVWRLPRKLHNCIWPKAAGPALGRLYLPKFATFPLV